MRERTAIEVVQFGILLYLKGLSFRAVRDILVYLGIEISHVAIWKWFQRFGKKIKPITFLDNGDMPSTIVVDETCIKIGRTQFYLYAAICPESKRIIYFDLFPIRNYLATFNFFKTMITLYGRPSEVVIIDGGHWYPAALQRLGIRYRVVSGDIRNYIER
ncbi:MAG: DDE-type integrase/transposase/recombinase [Methanocellales archaeon]